MARLGNETGHRRSCRVHPCAIPGTLQTLHHVGVIRSQRSLFRDRGQGTGDRGQGRGRSGVEESCAKRMEHRLAPGSPALHVLRLSRLRRHTIPASFNPRPPRATTQPNRDHSLAGKIQPAAQSNLPRTNRLACGLPLVDLSPLPFLLSGWRDPAPSMRPVDERKLRSRVALMVSARGPLSPVGRLGVNRG
jgi:hypothetical protein